MEGLPLNSDNIQVLNPASYCELSMDKHMYPILIGQP